MQRGWRQRDKNAKRLETERLKCKKVRAREIKMQEGKSQRDSMQGFKRHRSKKCKWEKGNM